jgi:hypothetical protein
MMKWTVIYKNAAPTSQKTLLLLAKINQLMLFSETSLFIMRTIETHKYTVCTERRISFC